MGRQRTHEEFIKLVEEILGNEYKVVGTYKNCHTKILMKHLKCGYEYYTEPNNIIHKKTKCPNCDSSRKKTHKEFLKNIYDLVGNEYNVIGEYINNRTKIRFKHNICNNEFYMKPNLFLNGDRCPICSNRIHKDENDIKKLVSKLGNNEYELVKYGINVMDNSTIIKHIKCNKTFNMRFNNFQQGQRCPYCKTVSKGEEKIRKFLNDNNIKFVEQKKFKNCKYKRELPFDFQIFINNSFILLEYDGIQHFEESFPNSSLEIIKKRDNIKNKFCKDNNINLYRINYTDFNNIENILKDIIKI